MTSPSISLIHPRHDAQQRALARAVETEHADLGPVEIGKLDVLQHDLACR